MKCFSSSTFISKKLQIYYLYKTVKVREKSGENEIILQMSKEILILCVLFAYFIKGSELSMLLFAILLTKHRKSGENQGKWKLKNNFHPVLVVYIMFLLIRRAVIYA